MRLWELFSNPNQKIAESVKPKKSLVKTLESRILVPVNRSKKPR